MLGLPVGWLVKWPWLPVTSVVKLAEVLAAEAEKKLTDPIEIRRELEQISWARQHGEMSQEEADEAEKAVLARLIRR